MEVPLSYGVAIKKHVKVTNYWDKRREWEYWKIELRRNLNDWEMDEMASLLRIVGNIYLRNEVEDSLRWFYSKNGVFSVSSYRNRIGDHGEQLLSWR